MTPSSTALSTQALVRSCSSVIEMVFITYLAVREIGTEYPALRQQIGDEDRRKRRGERNDALARDHGGDIAVA